jgi:hypothetical protein
MSQRAWRKVLPSALLSEGRVEVEGSPDARLPGGRVYVSPTTGRSYDGDRGDTLASLPADAVEVRKQAFGLRIWGREGERPSSLFSKWYESQQGLERLRRETQLMQAYFPDFGLCRDEASGQMAWTGKIEGIGELEIVYPEDYPARHPFVNILGKEDLSVKVNVLISQSGDITPVATIIIAMRFFIEMSKKGEKDGAVVSKPEGSDQAKSGDSSDAKA